MSVQLLIEDLMQLPPNEFTPHLISVILKNLSEIDPCLPELAKALAIPKFFDDDIIRLFIPDDAPITIDEAKSHLVQAFLVSQGRRCYFHDTNRDELLKYWQNDKDGLCKYQDMLKIHYLNKADYFKRQYESYLRLFGEI